MGVTAILYFQYRKKSILYFLIFITGITFDVFSFLLFEMAYIPGDEWSVTGITAAGIINSSAGVLMLTGLPRFIHKILVLPARKSQKIAYNAGIVIQVLLTIIFFIFAIEEPYNEFVKLPLYLTSIFMVYLALKNYSTVGHKLIRQAITILVIYAVIELPVMIFNGFSGVDHLLVFASPLFLIIFTAISLVFSVRFFNQPQFLKDNQLSEYFVSNFQISNREKEILPLLIEGLNKEEIAEKLFISPNTVNNHIYNIYKKLKVKNRVQLLNFIKANQV